MSPGAARAGDEVVGVMELEWMARGKCRMLPPETFFPGDGVGVDIARRICRDCPVKSPCLEYALGEPHRPRRLGRHL